MNGGGGIEQLSMFYNVMLLLSDNTAGGKEPRQELVHPTEDWI